MDEDLTFRVRRVVSGLFENGPRRTFALEPFAGMPPPYSHLNNNRFLSVSAAEQVVRAKDDFVGAFFDLNLASNSELSRRSFCRMLSPVINQGLLRENGSWSQAFSKQPTAIYNSPSWIAVRNINTDIFTYDDFFIAYPVTVGENGWNCDILDWSFAKLLQSQLFWEIPEGCDAAKNFVMLLRRRTVYHKTLFPRKHEEMSAIVGYANLNDPQHREWLDLGWFPAQMGNDTKISFDQRIAVVPHPTFTYGRGIPGMLQNHEDRAAHVHTFSFSPRTGKVVCISIDQALVSSRLSLVPEVCHAIGAQVNE